MCGSNAALCQHPASMLPPWVCISFPWKHLEFLLIVSGMEWKAGSKPRPACRKWGQGCFRPRIGCLRRLQSIPKYPEELSRQQASQVLHSSPLLSGLGSHMLMLFQEKTLQDFMCRTVLKYTVSIVNHKKAVPEV